MILISDVNRKDHGDLQGTENFQMLTVEKLKIPSRFFSVHLFQKGSRSFNFRCNAPVRRIKMSENLEEKIFWLKNQLRRSKAYIS